MKKTLAFVALVALLVGAVASIWTIANIPADFLQAAASYCNAGSSDEKGKWPHKYFCEANIADAVIAVFTVVLVVVTALLAVIASRQGRYFQSVERPNMLMEELRVIGLRTAAAANGEVALKLQYKFYNRGKGIGFMRAICPMLALQAELTGKPKYGDVTKLRYTVTSGGWYGTLEHTNLTISDENRNTVVAGTQHFFMFGYLAYADIFGRLHKNRFAYRLIFDGADASKRFVPDGPPSYWDYT